MRELKEPDTSETIAGDSRPFIPGNILVMYASLEARLHVIQQANEIAHNEATAQLKLC